MQPLSLAGKAHPSVKLKTPNTVQVMGVNLEEVSLLYRHKFV